MLLDNSILDSKSYPVAVVGFIVDGQLDPGALKSAFERVVRHFSVLSARIHNGKELVVPENPKELFSWTVQNHTKPLAAEFTVLPKSQGDVIAFYRFDARARMDFYIPFKSTVLGRASDDSPLIEVRIQRFLDKTVIGISWDHFLTDVGGMAIVVSSWCKALRGEPLPEVASIRDPFRPAYKSISNPTLPTGIVLPGIGKTIQLLYAFITETVWYGWAEPRSIFIPKSVLRKWKSTCHEHQISTNDMITAWLLKKWASTRTNSDDTFTVVTVKNLRVLLSGIVPPTYLRNAASSRYSPSLKFKDINNMSQLEVAKIIRSIGENFSPEYELNRQAYEFLRRGERFRMLPEANCGFMLTSMSSFHLPQMNFGAKTESLEGFLKFKRWFNNVGMVWMEDEGARITFWMSKRRWNKL